jgi:hypothetical protein
LVFPAIKNIDGYQTIVEIANTSDSDVWVKCYMILPEPGPETEKKNFVIHITQKEPFFWNTSKRYSRKDASDILTQIGEFDGHKGFMFCWAIRDEKNQEDKTWNYLKGDALIFNNTNNDPNQGQAWQYNAISHRRGVGKVGKLPGVLLLDDNEYDAGLGVILFEGFSAGVNEVEGTLHVANLDINFITSEQPEFDINIECWNQNEVPFSRHLHFRKDRSYEQYDLREDLQLALDDIFTAKFWCATATTTTHPLWAVFEQRIGAFAWGGNVHTDIDWPVDTDVVLP